jgi:hypothetical protein
MCKTKMTESQQLTVSLVKKETMEFEATRVAVDKTERFEFVHKEANPRTSRANHLCQGFLANLGITASGPFSFPKLGK